MKRAMPAMRRDALNFIKRNLGGWLIILPSLALFVFFVWLPLFSNISLSLFETKGLNKEHFVWFENYAAVFKDALFLKALWNTCKYAFWSILIGFLLPIVMAVILNEVVHLKGVFRVFAYLPNMVPGVAAAILWTFLFDPSAGSMVNSILVSLGGKPSLLIDDSRLSIILIVVAMTWKGAGATMLIYLAALQGADSTYYEAARLDGANFAQRLRYVTLPYLLPNISVLFVLQIISVFQVFYEPMVMLDGGTDASVSLMLLSYNYAFRDREAGLSAATGVILAGIIFAFTGVYFAVQRRIADKN